MPNRIVHFEIEAADRDRAKNFYAQAFGWEMQQMGADPDGAGPLLATVKQYVYDATGHAVGTRVGDVSTVSSAGWVCTTLDGRGRPTAPPGPRGWHASPR